MTAFIRISNGLVVHNVYRSRVLRYKIRPRPVHAVVPSSVMESLPPLVLITGIGSFVGSHIAYATLKLGYRVRGKLQIFKLLVL